MRVRVPCPHCETDLRVDIARGLRPTRDDPGAMPEVQDVSGCPHAAALLEDPPDAFYEACCQAAAERAEEGH